MNALLALPTPEISTLAAEVAWKSSVILIFASLLHCVWRRRRPLLLSAVWNACIVALMVLPFTIFTPPLQVDFRDDAPQAAAIAMPPEIEKPPVSQTANPTQTPIPLSADTDVVETSVVPAPEGKIAASAPLPRVSLAMVIASIWLCGVGLMAARLLLALVGVSQLLRRAEEIDDQLWTARLFHWQAQLGFRRRVRLYGSKETTVPFACGVWRPVIVLPSKMIQQCTSRECDVVLLHELTHIARGDTIWQLLLLCVGVVYWWQPLLWLADRQIRNVRERVCDWFCVGTLGNRQQYADALLTVAESLVRPVKLGVGLAMVRVPHIAARLGEIAGGSQLKQYRPARYVSGLLLIVIGVGSSILGAGIVDAIADSTSSTVKDLHGDSLPAGAVARLGTNRLRHGFRVSDLGYSSDGRLLTSESRSWFYVWDAKTGKLLRRENLWGLFSLRYLDEVMLVARDKTQPLRPWKFTDPKLFPPKIEKPNRGGGIQEVAVGLQRADELKIRGVDLSLDGKTLVTEAHGDIDEHSKVQLWQFEPNKEITELKPLGEGWTSETAIEELILTKDGRRLVVMTEIHRNGTADQDDDEENKFAKIMVFDVRDQSSIATMVVPNPAKQNIRGIAVSPDGQRIALGTNNAKLRIYDVEKQERIYELEVPQPIADKQIPVTVLEFSPDGELLAGSGRGRKIWTWDVKSGELQQEFMGHRSWVEELKFAPDGKVLASGGQDGAVYQWDLATGERLNPEVGHEYWVFDASLSADGKLSATCGGDGAIRIWETDTGKPLRILLSAERTWIQSCCFSPDGSQIATAERFRIALFDVATGRLIWEEAIPKDDQPRRNAVSFSADGKRMAAIVGKRNVAVWTVSGKNRLAEFETEQEKPDEAVLARAKQAVNFNPRSYDRYAETACISSDGRYLALGTKTNMAASAIIEIWDIDSKTRIQKIIPEKGGADQIQFSPDGKQLVTAGHSSAHGWVDNNKEISSQNFEDSLILWDIASGKVIRKFGSRQPLSDGTRIANGVTFSPDGRYLITAERAGTVLVYEAATGEQLAELHGHTGWVNGIAISGNGKRLLSVSMDHTGLVWDFPAILAGAKTP